MTLLPGISSPVSRRASKALICLALGVAAASSADAQCGEDPLEENDSCAGAALIVEPFNMNGLVAYKTDPDYYTLFVPAGEEIEIEVFFTHALADVDLWLYDRNGPCGGIFSYLDRSVSSSDDERVSWLNTGSTPIEVAIKVEIFPGSLTDCNTYDMVVTVAPPIIPCDPATSDDAFEDNDSCATAVALPIGTTPALWASRDDEDFYRATLQPGASLDAQIFFVDSITDLDLFLYDANGPCGGGFNSGELVASFTQNDDERVAWSNTTGVAMDVILHVDVWNADSCNDYDLVTSITGAGIGTNYCTAASNSSGLVGLIHARGTTSVAGNDVTLRAEQLPLSSFAFFLNSLSQGFVPGAGGSQGNLCLGGSVGRHDEDIMNTGAAGAIELRLDMAALPQPNGLVAAVAGETWHFQAWHRDFVGGSVTSNLTNGVQIVLTP